MKIKYVCMCPCTCYDCDKVIIKWKCSNGKIYNSNNFLTLYKLMFDYKNLIKSFILLIKHSERFKKTDKKYFSWISIDSVEDMQVDCE